MQFGSKLRRIFLGCVTAATVGMASGGFIVNTAQAAVANVSDSTPAAQLIANLERLLFRSRSGERVATAADPEVQALSREASAQLAKAKAALAVNDVTAAKAEAQLALAKFMDASRRLPDTDPADLQAQATRYQSLRQGIDVFLEAHQRNASRLGAAEGQVAVVGFDAAAVTRMIGEAEQQAGAGDYGAANELLTKAQAQITGALRGMMNHRTLVHEVKIRNAEDEYHYELRRYQGYVELIPVAIEMKVPAAETVAAMRFSVDKSQAMLEQAKGKAGAGDFPVAIRMVLDATDEVRAALRQAGVEM